MKYTLSESVCPDCLANVIDMAGGHASCVTGFCPHLNMGWMLSLRPDTEPLLLQSKPMTRKESDALRDRVTNILRPRALAH